MYTLTIEFASLEDAQAMQQYINQNYNSSEVYWNAITKKKEVK